VAADALGVANARQAPAASRPPRIWLCADDFGIAPGVNAAIRELVMRGRLNATSVMVVAPSFDRAQAQSLKALNAGSHRVAIGLHLTLTAPFRPLSEGFAPLRDNAFPSLAELLRRALLRRLDDRALGAEIAAQLAAFAAAFDQPPDFVDGHQHVHLFPQVRDAVLAALEPYAGTAWVRQCGGAPLWQRRNDLKALVIGWLSREFSRRARAHKIAVNPAFAGTYAFTPGADFAALFPTFLAGLPDGGVVMCHPGHVDAELERLDPLTTLREKEFAFLAGDAMPKALAAQGVTLA
jgi:predicted glycoside hydrolase/deacetylase ChbG (UPF0249 family)